MSAAWERLAVRIDLLTPHAIRAAATLRLPDRIAAGTTDAAALAREAGADAGALARLLRYLACRGVLRETAHGRYALTDESELLRDDHPLGLRAWLDQDGVAGRMDDAAARLLESVRTGRASYRGRFWDDAAGFDELMEVHAASWVDEVVAARDWAGDGHVVDVGGGTGALLTALLRAHASLRGTLVELPATAHAAPLEEFGDRARIHAGSFFDPLPPGAGAYVLAQVLHDWPDEDALAILRRCAEAGGRVVVIERPLEHDPLELTGMDLRLLVVFGGRERTTAELHDLAAAAGLRVESVTPASGGFAVLECA